MKCPHGPPDAGRGPRCERWQGGGSSYETYTKPNKDVTTWEATYHGVQFDGEQLLSDPKRAPATRPKGG
jgi:hypothetical protein